MAQQHQDGKLTRIKETLHVISMSARGGEISAEYLPTSTQVNIQYRPNPQSELVVIHTIHHDDTPLDISVSSWSVPAATQATLVISRINNGSIVAEVTNGSNGSMVARISPKL